MRTCADRSSSEPLLLLMAFISPVPLFTGCVWLGSWKRKRTKKRIIIRVIEVRRHGHWIGNHGGEFRPELHWLSAQLLLTAYRGAALLHWRTRECRPEKLFNSSNTWRALDFSLVEENWNIKKKTQITKKVLSKRFLNV